MTNNQNELGDVMDVLEDNIGYLTDRDREIPETDVAVIKYSAWWEIPVLETEDPLDFLTIGNNQCPASDDWDKLLNAELYDMPRRSQANSESTPPEHTWSGTSELGNYHYSYNDISIGMDAMSMNNRNRDDGFSSSSSSSQTSEGSEWLPEETEFKPKKVVTSEPLSPTPPETETRRLTKVQRRSMTDQEVEQRRKEANKKNSKNYNFNKKSKEAKLKEDLEKNHLYIERATAQEKQTLERIMECYTYFGDGNVLVIHQDAMQNFTEKEVFEEKLEQVDMDVARAREQSQELKSLKKLYQKHRQAYITATNDKALKKSKINTYGSRKSRALHSMNIAELELKKCILQFKIKKFERREKLLEEVENQIKQYFNFKESNHAGYMRLPQERQNRFEELCKTLKTSSPKTSIAGSHRRSTRSSEN
ncbi:uncharacterized protein CELE_T07A5.7 [Caenorhabditis elegans]|uniref:Uncharacterized protein T07A5.7 n=1 Tax=Caenorhabditis elegans TaxID=6239 RepID=YRT7_CAEEL|nr:Uncharacterized protein CELE_T07A5.7 [Caenorhabditis elegans]A6ZJ55.2 RecName: Full=Uncharacterized protein T07A5.7 [Caenorhabditis elegans]CAO78722.2 Uncharacterized protein CELE_T07A5.7 [Caenorhabditis elegans]|eukprot:NP_001122718.2 Uncharacterized protein CELE_T07A5.7 [Caenorhabditis elegans]